MDVRRTGDQYAGGIPKAAGEWEAYILNQQAMMAAGGGGGHKPISRRRKTIVGIPTFADFVRDYEDGAHEQRRRPRHDNQQFSCDDKDVPFHDGRCSEDSLPHSFSSTASSFKRSKRHHRHDSASRPKLPETFKTASDLPRPDSPETFKRTIHESKAQFYATQRQRTHSRPRHKSLLTSILYDQPLQLPPPRLARQPFHQPAGTAYHLWRQECDDQLKDKATMTHVPAPPIPTCSECSNASILAGHPVPLACRHSLEKLLRTAITEPRASFASSKAYFVILKAERQRWHTDRFGACAPRVKPRIQADAQQLFVLINALFEDEKARILDTASFEPEPELAPPNQSYRCPPFFKFKPDERPAW